jgi:hypothetical protein
MALRRGGGGKVASLREGRGTMGADWMVDVVAWRSWDETGVMDLELGGSERPFTGVDERDGGDRVSAGRGMPEGAGDAGDVKYCTASFGAGALSRRRAARRSVIWNSCSIRTCRLQIRTKSYSHSGSSVVGPGVGPGVEGRVLVVLLGRCGRNEATGGATLRLRVEVCSLPGSRYGAENQATSSRPRGRIDPGGDKVKRYCFVSSGKRVSVELLEVVERAVRPLTGSRRTLSNAIPVNEVFCTRTSRWISDRLAGSKITEGEVGVWIRVLIARGGVTYPQLQPEIA